jgi:MFS family permease
MSHFNLIDQIIAVDTMRDDKLVQSRLKTPRAAAIAGILFSALFVAAFSLLRISVPSDPTESGEWVKTSSISVGFALNLLPFAGIAFLWFVGALRDRLGVLEDRFFSTVFLGSSLLFLAMLFTSAAAIGAIIVAFAADPNNLTNSAAFYLARTLAYNVANIYMVKMAGVFMISTSTVVVSTDIAPRWVALLGFVLALLLLFGSSYLSWIFVAFPLWVFLISVCFLIDEFRRRPAKTLL